MEKILVSACLCGINIRYDGSHGNFPMLEKLRKYYEIIPFCPEVEGGLKTPRTRAEIIKGQVMTEDGVNVTKNYNLGAEKALNLCHFLGIRIAILNDKSPSCGSRFIHDGSFKNNVIEGLGVTARVLIADGIKVYSDKDALDFLLPEEKKEKRRTNKHLAINAKPRRSFKKDGEEERPMRKRRFRSDENSEGSTSFERKPFKKRSFDKKDGFRKDEGRRPFRKDGERPWKSGEERPFQKRDGERNFKKRDNDSSSFEQRGSYGRKPYGRKPGEGRSYGRKPNEGRSFDRKPGEGRSYGRKTGEGRPSFNGKPYEKRGGFKGKRPQGRPFKSKKSFD